MMYSSGDESFIGKISYVESTGVGQAFKLGRYPFHFHMIGTVHNSYVEGNSNYRTSNWAISVQNITIIMAMVIVLPHKETPVSVWLILVQEFSIVVLDLIIVRLWTSLKSSDGDHIHGMKITIIILLTPPVTSMMSNSRLPATWLRVRIRKGKLFRHKIIYRNVRHIASQKGFRNMVENLDSDDIVPVFPFDMIMLWALSSNLWFLIKWISIIIDTKHLEVASAWVEETASVPSRIILNFFPRCSYGTKLLSW